MIREESSWDPSWNVVAIRAGRVSGIGGGLGEGDRFRGGGGCLPMFSNCALSEETGFSDEASGPLPACDSMTTKKYEMRKLSYPWHPRRIISAPVQFIKPQTAGRPYLDKW